MSDMESLAEQLRAKNVERVKQQQKNTQTVREWSADLHALLKDIQRWLEPLRAEGLIQVVESTTDIRESPHPDIDVRYTAPILGIGLGKNRLRIVPKGRYMVGSQGVVEVEGVPGYESVVLVRLAADGCSRWELIAKEAGKPQKREGRPFNEAVLSELLKSAV
ncbi:hypothetical protein [Stutzerimonas stutzeri]|jgi:hypothetical protein|uniref:hypothetical protein n=1 Tax=Stutzerimonas stutzeri TaxID=316 RepID=UPI002446E03B|nr:hypothetical protein [Stutzerimonas stutzeri]MDH0154367.1 hypothetical protein [Stutzerimonas stutzeri]